MKEILIQLREDNRYTQTAMAKLLGISRQAYMKYETGEVEPPVEVIRRLKKIYNVSYEILIDNRVDLVNTSTSDNPESGSSFSYKNHQYDGMAVASPAPAYRASSAYENPSPAAAVSPQTAAKQTIQNSSLEEFATMLFSVAANLKTEDHLTTEEKLAKFEVYAKLAETEMDIANGDKGEDIDTVFAKLMGEEWTKKHIQ